MERVPLTEERSQYRRRYQDRQKVRFDHLDSTVLEQAKSAKMCSFFSSCDQCVEDSREVNGKGYGTKSAHPTKMSRTNDMTSVGDARNDDDKGG